MESSTFYLIGLMQLALLGAVILGFQLLGLARYRKSYQALLARYKEQNRGQQGAGQAFLSRQLTETQKKQHSSPSSTHISVWQLRQFFLRNELDALACGESSEDYWRELEKRLLRVVNALKVPAESLQTAAASPQAEIAAPADPSQPLDAIDKRSTESLLAVINRQRELINYLREQCLSSEGEDKQGIDDHRPLINHRILHMGGGIAALDSQLQRSENRLWGLRDSVIDMQAPHSTWRQREDQDLRIIHHAGDDGELSEEDREQMQQEVDTLQHTIQLQQETINNFSQQLGQLREELLSSLPENEIEAQQLYIARLERLLQETEGCVQVLESELDYLRVRLQESAPAAKAEVAPPQPAPHSEAQLQTELAQLQTMLDNTLLDRDIQAAIIGFAMSGSQCRDLNELGAEALQSLTALGLAGALIIHCRSGRIELYDRSKINAAERKQLNSLTAGNRAQVMNVGQVYALATPSLSMLVKADEAVTSSMTTHINELMLTFSGLLNAFTAKLDAQLQHQKQAQTLKRLQQKTAQTIKGLDVQYKYQTKEFSNAVRQFMKQLEDSFKALPVDERQRRILQLIIEDFRTRMTLLLRSDLSIDKALAELTRSVDAKADR